MIATCHHCSKHKRVSLAMLCSISGKNIVAHNRADYCPLGMFGTKVEPEIWPEVQAMRPPMPIPEDFDPEAEKRRMEQGGCCGGSTRPG